MNLNDESNLINDLKSLSAEAIEQLVKKVRTDFQKDLQTIYQNYKLNIEVELDKEQTQLLNSYSEKSSLLQWIQQKIGELPLCSQQEESIVQLFSKTKQQFVLGLQAQKNLLIGSIDQLCKEIESEIPKYEDTPKQLTIKIQEKEKLIRAGDQFSKISCSICDEKEFDVITYRGHLRDKHQMGFQGYLCKYCGFRSKSLESFADHKIKEHENKTCMCQKSFTTKLLFCDHLRSCLIFYQVFDGSQNQFKKRTTIKKKIDKT